MAQQAVGQAEKRRREEDETPVVAPPATRSRAVAGGGIPAPAPAVVAETPRPALITETPRPETPPLVRANRSAGDTSFGSAEKTDERKRELPDLKKKLANMTEKARRQSEDAEVIEFWGKSAHKRNSKGKKK